MGRFSIRHKSGEYIVEKILARSGQPGFAETSWVTTKSPCPYGDFNLYTASQNVGQLAGERGIGECFPIDNQGDMVTICDPKNRKRKRKGICLHEENGIPGSEGCIVIVYHDEWLRVKDWLKSQARIRKTIPLEVM